MEEVVKYWGLAMERPDYFSCNHGKGAIGLINETRPDNGHVPKLLEIGCGNAEFCKLMSQLKWRPYAVDVVARDNPPFANFCVAPAWDLPFRDSFFDVVCAFDVFEHLLESDIVPAIQEAWRVSCDVVAIKPAFSQSGSKGVKGELLHPTVKPAEWWQKTFENALKVPVERKAGGIFLARKKMNE